MSWQTARWTYLLAGWLIRVRIPSHQRPTKHNFKCHKSRLQQPEWKKTFTWSDLLCELTVLLQRPSSWGLDASFPRTPPPLPAFQTSSFSPSGLMVPPSALNPRASGLQAFRPHGPSFSTEPPLTNPEYTTGDNTQTVDYALCSRCRTQAVSHSWTTQWKQITFCSFHTAMQWKYFLFSPVLSVESSFLACLLAFFFDLFFSFFPCLRCSAHSWQLQHTGCQSAQSALVNFATPHDDTVAANVKRIDKFFTVQTLGIWTYLQSLIQWKQLSNCWTTHQTAFTDCETVFKFLIPNDFLF